MALFPILQMESEIQVNDLTRFDATKSIASRGSSAITTCTITPGADATPQSVFNSDDSDLQYLDWVFVDADLKADINSANNKIDLSVGGTNLVATIATGSYTQTQLLAAIKTALETASPGVTFTLSADEKRKVTISATSSFALLPETGDNRFNGFLEILGFKRDGQGYTSVTGDPILYFPKLITVTIGDGSTTSSSNGFIKLMASDQDYLFASDGDLVQRESDILRLMRAGRGSFMDFHRRAQKEILDMLDAEGRQDVNSKPFTKYSFVDKYQVREISILKALELIYTDNIKKEDDVNAKKAEKYRKDFVKSFNRQLLKIDVDADGKVDPNEGLGWSSGVVVRE